MELGRVQPSPRTTVVCRLFGAVLGLLCLPLAVLQAQATGTITGSVRSAQADVPLASAGMLITA